MALKAGWDYAQGADPNDPNAMVRNQQTGQTLTQSHPGYTGGATGAVEEGGGVQAAGGGNPYDPVSSATATQATASQKDQGSLRDALISQMGQSTIPDANDPAIAAQVNPYKAAIERSRGDEVRREAESAYAGGQDYGVPEQQMAAERAGQQSGMMESQLVGREIQSRRDQVQQALQQFGGMLSGDQQRGLQKQLADLDAQLRREGYGLQSSLGQADIGLRKDLGYGQLNLGLLQQLFGNQQFNTNMGRMLGLDEANMNRDALMSVWG